MQIVRAVSKPAKYASLTPFNNRAENQVRQNTLPKATLAGLLLTSLLVSFQPQALAQGSPIPGGGRTAPPPSEGSYVQSNPFAPLPGSGPAAYAAPPDAHAHTGPAGKPESIYNALPLNAEDARIRLEDLSNRLATSRPDDVKNAIYALSDWMQDVADAHWKMFKAFEKSDATKVQAAKEKDIALKFSSLKNRAKLLKADLFIKQNRNPEALGPLVEIVTTEPTSATGQEAYKRLVDMGFSEQVSNVELAAKGAPKR
jgi:hypothetical protein